MNKKYLFLSIFSLAIIIGSMNQLIKGETFTDDSWSGSSGSGNGK